MPRFYNRSLIPAILIASLCMFGTVSANTLNQDNITIIDGAICRTVEKYEAIEVGNTFPASVEKLYCFTKVIGTDGATEVTHIWYYGNVERARMTLGIDSSNWRTYSSEIIRPDEIGTWHVVVLDESENLIESFSFNITPH